MTVFVQFHLLTPYPPSNPNRDDQGRPKQASLGGHPRLRLSSQSLKRAVRETAWFAEGLADHTGKRTKRPARWLLDQEGIEGRDDAALAKVLREITEAFGKIDEEKTKAEGIPVLTTLTFFSMPELYRMASLCRDALAGTKLPKRGEIAQGVFQVVDGGIDVAMFGRMLAGEKAGEKEALKVKQFEREAAVQVAHAFTTHRALAEDDYYTAVDDLNKRDDTGAGHLDTAGFGSGVYYLYACVNVDLLVKNLGGDTEARALAARGLEALARALATATPKGKQNSHAHHPLARHIRAELGTRQPRDLSGAFFHPVNLRLAELKSNDLMRASVAALEEMAGKLERAYGPAADAVAVLDVDREQGSLDAIARFAAQAVDLLAPADA